MWWRNHEETQIVYKPRTTGILCYVFGARQKSLTKFYASRFFYVKCPIIFIFRDFDPKNVKAKKKKISFAPKKLVIWNGQNGQNVVHIVDEVVDDEKLCAHYPEGVKASYVKIWIWKIRISSTFKIAILGTANLVPSKFIYRMFANSLDALYSRAITCDNLFLI